MKCGDDVRSDHGMMGDMSVHGVVERKGVGGITKVAGVTGGGEKGSWRRGDGVTLERASRAAVMSVEEVRIGTRRGKSSEEGKGV